MPFLNIITLVAVLILLPFAYIFIVVILKFISERKIDIDSIGRGRTYEGIKPLKDAIYRRTEKLLLGLPSKDAFLIWANVVLATAAVGGSIFTALTYYDTVKINENTIEVSKNINRPYIDLDTKSVKENLARMSDMILVDENLYRELPAEENLQFSIKNYGSLPAKYKVDFGDFRNWQFQTISQPTNIDYVYPDQTKELTFTYDYGSRAPLERMSEAVNAGRNLFSELDKISDEYIIKIKYGFIFQEESEFSYLLAIKRKYYRVPCEDGRDLVDPNTSCWRHKWVVLKTN